MCENCVGNKSWMSVVPDIKAVESNVDMMVALRPITKSPKRPGGKTICPNAKNEREATLF